MDGKRVISPTVGRMVHYYPNGPTQKEGGDQPEAAIVAFVHGDRLVNLTSHGPSGHPYAAPSVVLRQPDDVITTGSFAEWMDFQVGQSKYAGDVALLAKRIDALEAVAHAPIPAADLVAAAVKSDEFRDALAQADKDNPIKAG